MPKVTKIESLVEGKFISLYDLEYTNKLNQKKHWSLSSRKTKSEIEDIYFRQKEDEVDAVVIAAYHKTYQKLVLIKQFRVPLNDYIYELPAGLVDDGDESCVISAERELKEETGFDIVGVSKDYKSQKLYLSPGMTDESVSLIYCMCDGEINYDKLEDDEDIEVILVSQSEATQILNSNEKIDVKAFLVLQNFIMNNDKLFK